MKNLLSQLGLAIVLINLAPRSFAFEEPLPTQILSHSRPIFTIHRGDSFELETKIEGNNFSTDWIKEDIVVCSKTKCNFKAKDWSIGRHKIALIVTTPQKKLLVTFMVRVLPRPVDSKITHIRPELVPPKKVQILDENQLWAKTVSGIAYSHKKRKSKIIEKNVPSLLLWDTELRTNLQGFLFFGKAKREENFLMPSSSVFLEQTDTENKTLKIEKGNIRSRQIVPDKTRFRILVEDWLIITPEEGSDVIVSKTEPKTKKQPSIASIVVLRGSARVSFQDQEATPMIIPMGVEARFLKDKKQMEQDTPNSSYVTRILQKTTPSYFSFVNSEKNNHPEMQFGAFLSSEKYNPSKENLGSAIDSAIKKIEEQDFFSAIEILLPFEKFGKKRF